MNAMDPRAMGYKPSAPKHFDGGFTLLSFKGSTGKISYGVYHNDQIQIVTSKEGDAMEAIALRRKGMSNDQAMRAVLGMGR